ncbi:MAG: sugar nucleotide-binding protein [Bacilli bacterium]|nr:sugar nucleotide-binding protein [Bacilli bacterium]
MYLIVGANGFLGSYLIKNILDNTNDIIVGAGIGVKNCRNTNRITWVECNITDDESVDALLSIVDKNNLKIIYLAAYHRPDDVEKNKTLAWNINVTCLSKFINKVDFATCLYYASTDSVYGNSINNYHFKEGDSLNPVNFYGHNKCVAEAIVVHRGRNVVRFPFLISPSLAGKKHFYDEIVETVKSGNLIEMFKDSYRSSLSFDNASYLLVQLIEKGNTSSIVNICGDSDLSKYDVALKIAEIEGLDKSLIIPVSINKTQKNFVTKRADSTLMDNSLLKEILGVSNIDIFEKPIFK